MTEKNHKKQPINQHQPRTQGKGGQRKNTTQCPMCKDWYAVALGHMCKGTENRQRPISI
jgi:hypothetical protein